MRRYLMMSYTNLSSLGLLWRNLHKPPQCQSAQEHVAFRLPSSEAAGLAGMQLQLLKLPGHPRALSSLFELQPWFSHRILWDSHPFLSSPPKWNSLTKPTGTIKAFVKPGRRKWELQRMLAGVPHGSPADADVAAEAGSSTRISAARSRWLSPTSPGHPELPGQLPEAKDHTSAVESRAIPWYKWLSASEVCFFSKQEPNSWNSPKTMGKYDFLLRF